MSGVVPKPANCGEEQAVGTPSGYLLNPAEARPIDGPAASSRPGACRRVLSEKGRTV